MADPYRGLAAAIVRRAIFDLNASLRWANRKEKSDMTKERRSALKFVESDWCKFLCQEIDLDYGLVLGRRAG